jgi:hypothetical protein
MLMGREGPGRRQATGCYGNWAAGCQGASGGSWSPTGDHVESVERKQHAFSRLKVVTVFLLVLELSKPFIFVYGMPSAVIHEGHNFEGEVG